jgi:uncharacterized membrane protein
MNPHPWDLDRLVGSILLAGVILAGTLLATALLWQWISTGTFGSFPTIAATNLLGYMEYTFQNATTEGIGPVVLADTGIAVLLLTPFASVLASVLFFAFRKHDRAFTAITGFVMVILGIVLFAV